MTWLFFAFAGVLVVGGAYALRSLLKRLD